ncbi:hypothetical protein A2Z33_03830 [Candidatus Gottesmanbacteria bacterium RBG_16_52_11]|uniref:Glycosyltransferase RgtA/B/C/D-like domain-containing protein n=1 Tax=Candidatus Gottesmanbacteria bacterium RBG_16_52_11 TaxID=1798374 RepID=A0A1F5YWH7_9BACT|nr:MAG: hypothetical protein A2Z33_03830 [Candidatus Gottesmanbacteria bacterium RBG_16_52_11]
MRTLEDEKQQDSMAKWLLLAVAAASLIQTFVYIIRTPAGFTYPLVHNYEADYYWYLSLMRQGWDGKLSVTTRFTGENFPPQPVNTFFPVLGMVSRISGLSLPVIYTVARVAFGWGLLYMSLRLLRLLKLDKQQAVAVMILVVLGVPLWYLSEGKIVQAGEFWTGFDPILRITWLPHHLAANCLYLGGLILFVRLFTGTSLKPPAFIRGIVLAAVIFMAGAWINPAIIPLATVSLGLAIAISLVQRTVPVLKLLAGGSAVAAGLAGVTLALWKVQNSTFPWTAFRDWEQYITYPVTAGSYLLTLGLPGLLALPGIIIALKRKSLIWNMVTGWFLFPLLGLEILNRLLPLSNGRYLQGAGYIPAAILSVPILSAVAVYFRKTMKLKLSTTLAGTVLTIAVVIWGMPAFAASVSRQMAYAKKNLSNTQVLVPQNVFGALTELSGTPDCGIVMAPDTVSPLIPAFSSCRSVAGHPTFTFNPSEKIALLNSFYSGSDEVRAQEAVRQSGAAMILVFSDLNRNRAQKAGFRPVWEGSGIGIYGKISPKGI